MFVKQTLSLFAFLAGGSLLLTSCGFGGEPWQEYTGPETEGEKVNSFFHRSSGKKTCFVGRKIEDSLSGTYAGHYNPETAKIRFYAWVPQLKAFSGNAGFEATDIKVASINQPEDPEALAPLLLGDSPVDKKVQEGLVPSSISNIFTETSCWNGGKGLPTSLKNTIKEEF
jgi:hypothetical protein